jgi:hypothetical protein
MSSSDGAPEPLRLFTGIRKLGFITPASPLTPDVVSGMPWRTRAALFDRGAEVETLESAAPLQELVDRVAQAGPRFSFVVSQARRRIDRLKSLAQPLFPALTQRSILARARGQSLRIRAQLDAAGFDALFGTCCSEQLYALETTLPVVYFTDGTASMITPNYPGRTKRGSGFRDAFDELERIALTGCSAAVFPSREALASAIADYGLPRERGFVAPMGANVRPEAGRVIDPLPPEGRALRLLVVASDPVRKRVDFAIRVCETLARMSWDVRLLYVGPRHEPTLRSPLVEWVGRLRLSDAGDRARHADVLATSHLMLLPSMGEAFPIATLEAAHFGRPSVVADTGGLRTQITDGVNGLLMSREATPEAWAEAIDALVKAPDVYTVMCRAALARARNEFTWEAWGNKVVSVLEGCVAR